MYSLSLSLSLSLSPLSLSLSYQEVYALYYVQEHFVFPILDPLLSPWDGVSDSVGNTRCNLQLVTLLSYVSATIKGQK